MIEITDDKLSDLVYGLNTFFPLKKYEEIFGESHTATWRAIANGELAIFKRGKRVFVQGHSAAKRHHLEHMLRKFDQ